MEATQNKIPNQPPIPTKNNQIKHYDPSLNSKGEKKESNVSIVWTTKNVNQCIDMILLGKELDRSPFYEGNINIRKADLVFHLTKKEYEEYVRCASDILYFIDTYCKIKLPDGTIGKIKKLRKYQLQQIIDIFENDEVILGWSRQSGKTIGTVLYILWCILFNVDKQVAILANKAKTSGEVLEKLQDIYKNLPFWLKAGVVGWNTTTLSLDNGCKVYTAPTTSDALNGRTCNILYIDEFAYVGKGKNKIETQKDFLANAIPILASQKDSGLCKLIISSTPFGKDYFYELFDGALKGKNSMKASIVRWWQIPNRDLEWAKKEMGIVGKAKFKQQYEISFDLSSKTLLKASTMKRLSKQKSLFEVMDGIVKDYTEYFKINPNETITNEDFVCMAVDIAEGLEKDYSTIQLLKPYIDTKKGKIKFKQVAKFSCNTIPIDEFTVVVSEIFSFFDESKVKLLVESNTYGDYFFKCLDDNDDIEIPFESVCMFKRSSDNDKLYRGLRTNAQIKSIAVSSFKDMTDNEILEIYDEDTIKEIENFQEDDKGNYKASIGNDDEVTPLINFCYWCNLASLDFQNWIYDYLEDLGISYEITENE